MEKVAHWFQSRACTVALLCAITAAASRAQTLTTLANFNGTNGAFPVSLVQGNDGNFYGVTQGDIGSGNSPIYNGSIFKVTPSGTLTNLYTFCPLGPVPPLSTACPDGAQPYAMVQGTDGNFYGTTAGGYSGTPGYPGTAFKITPDGALTPIHYFASNGAEADGKTPLMRGSDGNFYGTSLVGGEWQDGDVFKITPDGVVTRLYSFGTTPSDGLRPISPLIQGADGNLYGTTLYGGKYNQVGVVAPFNYGTVFKITLDGALTTLYSFGGVANDPSIPISPLVQGPDGSFFGLTRSGGLYAAGSIFKITPSGVVTLLYSFTGSGPDGTPGGIGQLVLATDGNIYGVANGAGTAGLGIIFKLTPDGAFTLLHSFTGSDGQYPGTLIQGPDGNLYGTTAAGGAYGLGAIFRLQLSYACTNTAPPMITSVNSAGGFGGYSYFTSGSWREIKGANLAEPTDPRLNPLVNDGQWASSDFSGVNAPTSLDGISVSINGKAAFVSYISPSQINVQSPGDSTVGNVAITVTNCKATSLPFMLERRTLAPGLLAPPNYSVNGKQYMVATFASDGVYVLNTSTGAAFGLPSRPAKPGDVIVAYGIGFGDVNPAIQPGIIVQQSNTLLNPVTLLFGSANATLAYSGLAGNYIGLYEFFITVPSGLANGDYQINIMQNGTLIPQSLYLTVQN